MTTHDPALDHLRDVATQTWDADAARTLMAHLAPDTSQLVTRDYLDLRLAAEIGGLRGEMHTELASVRTEIAGLRSEMHSVMAAQTRWLVGTMIGSVFAFGTVITAFG